MIYRGKWHYRLLNYLILFVVLAITLIPIYVVVSNAFRPTLQIKEMPPRIIFQPTLKHFESLIRFDNFLKYFRNSIVISVAVTCITLVFGSLAGYALKLFKSRLGEQLSNMLLLGKLVPSITILIPLFVMLNRVRLTGTYVGPILAHSAICLPFVIWLMAGFVRDLPAEILEASCVEGATRMQTFWRVVFPMLTPAIASALVLVMQFSWNELMFSLALTNIHTYPLILVTAEVVLPTGRSLGNTRGSFSLSSIPTSMKLITTKPMP